MAKALSQFYSMVLPHVLGCPTPLLDQALVKAAIELCTQTGIAQDINTQAVTANVGDYDVDVPTGMTLETVLDVWHADKRLKSTGTDELLSGVAARGDVGNAVHRAGTPESYFQKSVGDATISLYPVPDTTIADGLAIHACYVPTVSATTLPDILLDRYGWDLAAGAMAFLQSLPSQPFTNPIAAGANRARFMAAINEIKPIARAGRVLRSSSVKPRRFA